MRHTTALLGEMPNGEALVHVASELRARGYSEIDARTPHEVEGLDEALGLHARPVRYWTLAGGVLGGVFAYVLQWWVCAVDWPLDVGGRPLHSAPAFIPITFETIVLAGGLATLVGLLVHARLGRLWEPLDEVDALRSATVDGFWIVIDGTDPRLDWEDSARHLRELGASRVVALREQEGSP